MATMPIVPITTMDRRAKKSGISTGKKTKNNKRVKSSRQNITRRFVSNFPTNTDDEEIGARISPSLVPCSISLLYVGDNENIPLKKNVIQRIGEASCVSEKSMIEKVNLKEARIINDNMK
jgi:hypothetical protein